MVPIEVPYVFQCPHLLYTEESQISGDPVTVKQRI